MLLEPHTGSTTKVTIDLQNGTAADGDAQGDTLTSIENVTGSNGAASVKDTLYGDANANILLGLGGNDFLEGGGGADVIDGGAGWDTVRYTRSTSGVTVNLATNVNTGGHAAGDLLYNIEAVTGSNYDDTLTSGYSPGSTLKKKKGQTSDQCGTHQHSIGGLTHANTQGLGPTVPPPGLFSLSADQSWQHERHLHLSDPERQTAHLPLRQM